MSDNTHTDTSSTGTICPFCSVDMAEVNIEGTSTTHICPNCGASRVIEFTPSIVVPGTDRLTEWGLRGLRIHPHLHSYDSDTSRETETSKERHS